MNKRSLAIAAVVGMASMSVPLAAHADSTVCKPTYANKTVVVQTASVKNIPAVTKTVHHAAVQHPEYRFEKAVPVNDTLYRYPELSRTYVPAVSEVDQYRYESRTREVVHNQHTEYRYSVSTRSWVPAVAPDQQYRWQIQTRTVVHHSHSEYQYDKKTNVYTVEHKEVLGWQYVNGQFVQADANTWYQIPDAVVAAAGVNPLNVAPTGNVSLAFYSNQRDWNGSKPGNGSVPTVPYRITGIETYLTPPADDIFVNIGTQTVYWTSTGFSLNAADAEWTTTTPTGWTKIATRSVSDPDTYSDWSNAGYTDWSESQSHPANTDTTQYVDEQQRDEPGTGTPGYWTDWTPAGYTDWSTDSTKPADDDTHQYGDEQTRIVTDPDTYTDWSDWTPSDWSNSPVTAPADTDTEQYRITDADTEVTPAADAYFTDWTPLLNADGQPVYSDWSSSDAIPADPDGDSDESSPGDVLKWGDVESETVSGTPVIVYYSDNGDTDSLTDANWTTQYTRDNPPQGYTYIDQRLVTDKAAYDTTVVVTAAKTVKTPEVTRSERVKTGENCTTVVVHHNNATPNVQTLPNTGGPNEWLGIGGIGAMLVGGIMTVLGLRKRA